LIANQGKGLDLLQKLRDIIVNSCPNGSRSEVISLSCLVSVIVDMKRRIESKSVGGKGQS
jgi:hypothetical protein